MPSVRTTCSRCSCVLLFTLLSVLAACRIEWGAGRECAPARGGEVGSVSIYTSAYPQVVDELAKLAKQELPHVSVSFLTLGSEKLVARLSAELEAGVPAADLLMASDPVVYRSLARRRVFHPYVSPRALKLDRIHVQADGMFVSCRISLMGLAMKDDRSQRQPIVVPPGGFADVLKGSKLAGALTLPDPLSSGTMMSTLLVLDSLFDNQVAQRLSGLRATASGGGAQVIDRLLRGQAAVGFALLENVELSQGSYFIVPEEGVIAIPGELAWLEKPMTPSQQLGVQSVYDWLLSARVQEVFTRYGLLSPFADVPRPKGAPPNLPIRWPDYDQLVNGAASAKERFKAAYESRAQLP